MTMPDRTVIEELERRAASNPPTMTLYPEEVRALLECARAGEEARGILMEMVEPDMNVSALHIYARAKATEARLRQALAALEGVGR